jgi:hypothetical protein
MVRPASAPSSRQIKVIDKRQLRPPKADGMGLFELDHVVDKIIQEETDTFSGSQNSAPKSR